MLARDVHDPAIGLLTVTRVQVTADLQQARVYYTQLGDDRARRETTRALGRATPFLRRQLGARLSLRRVPELQFHFDASIAHQARIEEILLDLEAERRERAEAADARGEGDAPALETDSAHPDLGAAPPDDQAAERDVPAAQPGAGDTPAGDAPDADAKTAPTSRRGGRS